MFIMLITIMLHCADYLLLFCSHRSLDRKGVVFTMKSTRKMLALVLALVLCLALFPASASAAAIESSGRCGPGGAANAEFVLYTDGKLVINGQGRVGRMDQWCFFTGNIPGDVYNPSQDAIRQTRSEIKTLVIGEGIRQIDANAFQDCANLVSVELPLSLTDGMNAAIGASAFRNCSSLNNVYIPGNVQTIDQSAFQGCTGLTAVYLSDGLQRINQQAFFDCTALRTITIPANVVLVDQQAFGNCGSLKEVYFTGNAPAIDWWTAFQNVKADVYYPVDNESWNQAYNPMVNNPQFGGRLTWHTAANYTESDGWVRKNGNWYYYMNGVMVRDNWAAYEGYWFYFDENGRMLTGRQLVGDKYYYFDPTTGARQSGWRNGEFYDEYGVWQPAYSGVNDTGIDYFTNGWQQLADGKWYYIRDKAKVTGWLKGGDGCWYYLDPTTGAMVTGWLTWNGNTYYLRPLAMADADGFPEGSMIAGRTERIGDAGSGQYYTFGDDGVLLGGRTDQNPLGNLVNTGWQRDLDANGNPNPTGGWYFYRSDGSRVSGGWELISNGMQNNLGNNWYYFNDNGTMKTGWLDWGGGWYYLTPANSGGDPRTSTTGQMVTGFQSISTTPQGVALSIPKVYFFKSNGELNGQGWIKVSGKWYYLRSDGSIEIGWIKDGNNWYYLADDTQARPNGSGNYNYGEMVTGVVNIPATLKDGRVNAWTGENSFLANGIWIDYGANQWNGTAGGWDGDQYFDTDGVALSGWQYIDNKWYYLNPSNNNKRAKGFFKDNTGTWFYTDSSGVMQKGWQQVDGTWYFLSNDDGHRVTGWLEDPEGSNTWYYLDKDTGGMATGVTEQIDGEYYAFNSDGVCTGWVAG